MNVLFSVLPRLLSCVPSFVSTDCTFVNGFSAHITLQRDFLFICKGIFQNVHFQRAFLAIYIFQRAFMSVYFCKGFFCRYTFAKGFLSIYICKGLFCPYMYIAMYLQNVFLATFNYNWIFYSLIFVKGSSTPFHGLFFPNTFGMGLNSKLLDGKMLDFNTHPRLSAVWTKTCFTDCYLKRSKFHPERAS